MFAVEAMGSYTKVPTELAAVLVGKGFSAMYVTSDARMVNVSSEPGTEEPDWEASEGIEDDYDYPEYDGCDYDDEPTYAQELAMYGGIDW